MGGSSYDRDIYKESSSSSWSSSYSGSSSFGASDISEAKLSSTSLDSSMLPNGKILKSTAKSSIIIVLDVTGSNIDFARVVYDKMPMFYGQIEQKGYLKDFEISVCAVGDSRYDNYPLQIANFAKGTEIDSWLEKLVLEGNGGPWGCESYELAAYYLLKNTNFENGSQPIIFFIADEEPYPTLERSEVEKIGLTFNQISNPFVELRKKVKDNVFGLINKPRRNVLPTWKSLLAPQHTIEIKEEKSIIDLMLGIISMISSTRTLDTYKLDMLNRGQTHARIANVSSSLDGLSKALVPVTVTSNIVKSDKTATSTQKGKRL